MSNQATSNQTVSNQTVSNQTIELLQNHRVYREFDSSATVPDSQLNDIIKCAQQAPSWQNGQHYSIINITDPALRAQIVALQPGTAVGMGDLPIAERAAYLREQLARIAAEVLRIASDRFDVNAPLTALGLDSLVAIQVRNRLLRDTGVQVPLVELLRGASVAALADQLTADARVEGGVSA